MDDPHFMESYL